MQARDRRVGVVEDRRVARERDEVRAHRVRDAHPGQPRRGDGPQPVDRHGDHPGGDHRRAQAQVHGPRPAMQRDQRARQHDELRRHVDGAQQPGEGGRVERPLDARLEGDAQRALKTDDPGRVIAGHRRVAGEHPARSDVEQVRGQEERQLGMQAAEGGCQRTGHGNQQRNQSLDLPLHAQANFSSVCFNTFRGRLRPSPRRRRAHQAAPDGRDARAARRARRGRRDAARHHDRRGRERGQRQLPLRLARGALLRHRQAGRHAPARRAAGPAAGARRRRHRRADRGRDRHADHRRAVGPRPPRSRAAADLRPHAERPAGRDARLAQGRAGARRRRADAASRARAARRLRGRAALPLGLRRRHPARPSATGTAHSDVEGRCSADLEHMLLPVLAGALAGRAP